jgi:hypothetical protein
LIEVQHPDENAKAVLDYSRTLYRFIHSRYEWLEQKAARYLTVLAFVIGSANVVVVPQVLRQFEPGMWPKGGAVFAALAAGMLLSGMSAIALALWAMRPQPVPSPPSDPEAVMSAFAGQSSQQVAIGEAGQLLKAATELRAINETRARALKRAFWLMLISFGFYVGTLAVLFVVRWLAR